MATLGTVRLVITRFDFRIHYQKLTFHNEWHNIWMFPSVRGPPNASCQTWHVGKQLPTDDWHSVLSPNGSWHQCSIRQGKILDTREMEELNQSQVGIQEWELDRVHQSLGLCIVYLKWYDTYHNTHEAIFDMYQQYILSGSPSPSTKQTSYIHKLHGNLGILMTKIP